MSSLLAAELIAASCLEYLEFAFTVIAKKATRCVYVSCRNIRRARVNNRHRGWSQFYGDRSFMSVIICSVMKKS